VYTRAADTSDGLGAKKHATVKAQIDSGQVAELLSRDHPERAEEAQAQNQ
jgi:hypothetical protein